MDKATLLVVDDDQALLELFTRKLERLSYKVYRTASGVEALEILQRDEIDMLITDFMMPGMNGAEIISKAIKIDPMLQSIVVTGYSALTTAIDVMGAGAFNYLPKPIDFKELDVTIQKGLEKRKLLQEVQNKQQQLDEHRELLEELVEKRTSALTATNLTLKREIEERKRLEISLLEAKVVAENANKAKSEFLANMSHEIRTPMTSAIGLLNLLLDTELLPKQKTYLEMARISTVVMHNLLNDILDFSKIEAGKLYLESISFDPRKVIESVIDLRHFQAEEKVIQLSCYIESDVAHSFIGDPNRLRQIILNLVSNAIKFTQYGEVRIKCQNATTEENSELISSGDKHKILHFSVQDSGIGIDKDKIQLIFEAFTQADSSTTREFGGVGLGLNICNKLVALMGGRIWVISEPGQGSTFHFTCKFGRDGGNKGIKGDNKVKNLQFISEPRDEKDMTILLVEDDQSNRWVFRELLKKLGYTVVTVSDGLTALQEIANQYFDIILLDLQLPEMNGYEVVHQIRKQESKTGKGEGQHLPIIAMTGYASENEKQKCLAAGMSGFIAKPFTVEQLLTEIRMHIGDRLNMHKEEPRGREQAVPNTSILEREIFNEDDALRKASGNREVMVGRITAFLQKTPRTIEMLRKIIVDDDKALIEQEVHRLNELAMEIGATNFADEFFSLLMDLRKKQDVDESRIDILANELEKYRNEQKILTLLGG